MSDHDRGPYSSHSEPPLSFDPRRPVRGAGPVPLTLIVSGLVLVALIVVVAFIYRGGVRRGDQPPAPVGAPLTDIRTPAPPETADDNAAPGLTIYRTNDLAAANAAPVMAPPPEQPQPLPAAPVAPVAHAALPPPQPATNAVAAAPPARAPSIGSLADAAEAGAHRPAAVAAPPARAAAPPAALPHAAQAAVHAPPPPAPPAQAAVTPPTGQSWVQIGATSSPALAQQAWNDVARLQPGAMMGRGIKVEPVNKDGKTLYRAYVTGFSSRAQADAFCAKLKGAGRSCIVR